MPRKRKRTVAKARFIAPEDRPELFRVTSNGESWRAHLIVDGNAFSATRYPVAVLTLQRWRATWGKEPRMFHLRWWFTESRFINHRDLARLQEMDVNLYKAAADRCLNGGEDMVWGAVRSLGDLSILGWERILLPPGYDGWSAWDMPGRQTSLTKGWVNASLVSPTGRLYRVGWSLVENRWGNLRTEQMVRLREECPEGVLEWVAQYLCEEYTPHLPQHDEEVA